MISVFICTGP